MYKRMLRSVLATAFVGALAYGVVSATDITWQNAPSTVVSDVVAAPAPGDITWPVAPHHSATDITWGTNDITWGNAFPSAGA